MYNCTNCLENYWTFENIEGLTIATCELCGYEVQLGGKKKYNHPPKQAVYEMIDGIMHLDGLPAKLKITPKWVKVIHFQKDKLNI